MPVVPSILINFYFKSLRFYMFSIIWWLINCIYYLGGPKQTRPALPRRLASHSVFVFFLNKLRQQSIPDFLKSVFDPKYDDLVGFICYLHLIMELFR